MNIRCRIYLLLASLGSRDEPRRPSWLGHHLEHCRDCQRSLAAEHELHVWLQGAPPSRDPLPPGLKSRILAAIESAPHPTVSPWIAVRWQTAGIAIVTIAILFAVLQFSHPAPETSVTESSTSSVERQLASTASAQLPLASEISRLLRDAGTPTLLEKEVLLAMDDGRRAFAHAIHSVVPAAAAQTILNSAFEMLPNGPPPEASPK